MSESENFLPEVKGQYEEYPYPPRNPEDESKRLWATTMDSLDLINYYGYAGLQDFKQGYRVLVAGGGTGDATIYLAHQLRNIPNAEVVYVDLSSASMGIARARAEKRGLTNIRFIQGSLLDVASMDIGKFDYINCCGVLHHLEDPNEGLKSLTSVLNEDGLMGIMVYAKYGRSGVYLMQSLMRELNQEGSTRAEKVECTRKILDGLPNSHLVKSASSLWKSEVGRLGDSGLFDLYLHSQDRAYTVSEIGEWLDGCSMSMLTIGFGAMDKASYTPEFYVNDPEIRERLASMSFIQRASIAEMFNGRMIKHTVYVGKPRELPDIKNGKLVPFVYPESFDMSQLADVLAKTKTPKYDFVHGKLTLSLDVTPEVEMICRLMDGKNSVNRIVELAESKLKKKKIRTNVEKIRASFDRLYRQFNASNMMLLRAKGIGSFKTDEDYKQMSREAYMSTDCM